MTAGSPTFNLADLFECIADAVPDRTALVAGDVRLTYRELDERANRIAHHLAGIGVGPGDSVGIQAYNRAEWIETMLGAYKIRAVPINVNFRYVEDELAYLFADADLVALVHDAGLASRIAVARGAAPSLRHFVALDDGSGVDAADVLGSVSYDDVVAAASPARDFGPRSSDDRYVIYTGGTTGMPKGTIWRHEDIFFAALQGGNPGGPPIEKPEDLARHAANDQAVYLVNAPMMHGGGQWVALICFYIGGKTVLNTSRHFDADEVWRLVEQEGVHSVSIIGDAMGRPLAEALAEADGRYDTSTVFVIGSGGAILSHPVKQQLRAQLPNAIILDSFGGSETGHNGSGLDADAEAPRFAMNDQTAVFDDELKPVVPGSGVVGRLARRGHIPLGYHKDPEKTAATFLEIDGERWVLPGDYATVEEDGTVTLLGRGSVCINTGGEKVYPEEVEAVLKAHPDVFDAIVVGIPDDRWGQKVAALVQPRPGARPAADDVAAHCRTKLADYKTPRKVVFLDELVRTPVGKPDYRWAKDAAVAAD